MYAVVDCNSFFASCEQVFNPKLQKKPIVVLSSNDGCVVARSKEAKALGIPMGALAFEYKALFRKYGVHVFSSNFRLYLNMSQRVMSTIRTMCDQMEVYSIDEAFVSLHGFSKEELIPFAKKLQQRVLQWTGIPVSIGIAPTKTLTKVAIHYAKEKKGGSGIFVLDHSSIYSHLEKLPIAEVWGIGRRLSAKLYTHGIFSAKELIDRDDLWIKKQLTTVGLRLALELRGTSCLEVEEIADAKKTITTAKSFEQLIFSLEELEKIIANYTASIAEKMRAQDSEASYISIFLETNRFGNAPYYGKETSFLLPEPTSYTPTLIHFAVRGLRTLFKEGFGYKRVGVLLGNFTQNSGYQQDIFSTSDQKARTKQHALMQLVDDLNRDYGKNTIRWASEGARPVRCGFSSASYTTSWQHLPVVLATGPSSVYAQA